MIWLNFSCSLTATSQQCLPYEPHLLVGASRAGGSARAGGLHLHDVNIVEILRVMAAISTVGNASY